MLNNIIETIIIGLIIICILVFIIGLLSHRLNTTKFLQKLAEIDAETYHDKLVDKVKDKIALTRRAENKFMKGGDLVAEAIYRQNDTQQLGNELRMLYQKELDGLSNQYPSLTDLDLLVITLLGMQMDNLEICNLLHMEKRTLYRRRQLIAQRMGISSMDLDDLAHKVFNDIEQE